MEKTSSNVVKQTKLRHFHLFQLLTGLASHRHPVRLSAYPDRLQNNVYDKTVKPLQH